MLRRVDCALSNFGGYSATDSAYYQINCLSFILTDTKVAQVALKTNRIPFKLTNLDQVDNQLLKSSYQRVLKNVDRMLKRRRFVGVAL